MIIKPGKQLSESIAAAYKANIPVLLIGTHGIGKSEGIEQAAKALDIQCVVRDLSLMEPPDLLGLPTIRGERTVYAPPAFLPTEGSGLLVFEEINRAERFMMAPCLQLLTARCLNDYRLPKGWLPVAAINPSSEGYDVNHLDPALLSRFMQIRLEADVQTWLEWATTNEIDADIMNYIRSVPGVFESSNPRAWKYVSDFIIRNEASETLTDSLMFTAASGLVGDIHATAFMQHRCAVADYECIDPLAIINSYATIRSNIIVLVKAKNLAPINTAVHNIKVWLQDSEVIANIQTDEIWRNNLKVFIKDLPPDLAKGLRKYAISMGVLV